MVHELNTFLTGLGVPEWRAWVLAGSGKGWWRLAGSLVALTERYNLLNQ